MEALENAKHVLLVLRRDADSIVPDNEVPLTTLLHSGNMHLRGYAISSIFDRVPDKVLQKLQKVNIFH